jgi:hypothetical protein
MEEKQPWITCYVTDMLLSYVRENLQREDKIDYAALFQGVEGLEPPADPKSFLADVKNWIPLSVLRALETQCEKLSGNKDITYEAAKAYFTPGRKQLPSLFEVIVQVLNDVRSALQFANFWGTSQTNYLKLQAFERPDDSNGLFMLAHFDRSAGPTIGAINLLKGFVEGFPRIYPFIDQVTCVEEISQLRLDDIVREFPLLSVTRHGDSLVIHDSSSEAQLITARRVYLGTESVMAAADVAPLSADTMVVDAHSGQMDVLMAKVDPAPAPPHMPICPASALRIRLRLRE